MSPVMQILFNLLINSIEELLIYLVQKAASEAMPPADTGLLHPAGNFCYLYESADIH